MTNKTAKVVKMHNFLACVCKSQDFALSQKFFVGLHDCVTATFRNSGSGLVWGKEVIAWIRFMIG